jgi:GTPase SAR1 family protein
MLKIEEVLNKKIQIKPIKMNTNGLIPNGQEPFKTYNFALLVVGQPNSGKTSFVLDQLTRSARLDVPEGLFYKKFNQVFIFSPSLNTVDKPLPVPKEQIFTEYDPEILQSIVNNQQEDYENVKEINKEIDEFNKDASPKDKKPHETHNQILVILDDMMTEISKDKSKSFTRMLMNRRHLCISIICISQVFNRIPSKLRKGFSDVVIFNTKNRKETDSIRDELTAFNPNEFKQLIENTLIEQHDFLLFKTFSNKIYRNLNLLNITEYSSESS